MSAPDDAATVALPPTACWGIEEQTALYWRVLVALAGGAAGAGRIADPRSHHALPANTRKPAAIVAGHDHQSLRKRCTKRAQLDYRYCWLRDAFFVVRALNSPG